MTSFQRQLNLYGFRRVTKGEDVGSYYHPKFQKGRRDLIAEIKRLPGKTGGYGQDEKTKGIMIPQFTPESRYNPTEGNIVEIIGSNNRPITMSKLTMRVAGIHSSDASVLPLQYSGPNIVSAPTLKPAYVAENAVQFLPNSSLPSNSSDDTKPHLTTVCLTREADQNPPPPLLLRNFSVSSSFDEEYRLSTLNEEDIPPSTTSSTSPSSSSHSSTTNGVTNQNESNEVNHNNNNNNNNPDPRNTINVGNKPQPIIRDESESWVKLGALDQLNDMDPFDIDTVFE